jgi:hypothetical protein
VKNTKKNGYTGNHEVKIVGKDLAKPGPTDIRIDMPNGYSIKNESIATCTGISGSKCL